jgi:hypothetical protein
MRRGGYSATRILNISDTDAACEEWKALENLDGLIAARETPYWLREFAHINSDGEI